MNKKKQINIGTSGWHYKHWVGPFYPEKTDTNKMLEYYAQDFNTVEINNSFYQMPSARTLKTWVEITPDDFFFAVKASRYITHMKKLKDPEDPVKRFMKRAKFLGNKMGPILFQLPPRWKFNRERLASFLDPLPKGPRYAFEFRDETWFCDEAYQILRNHNAAFCIYQIAGRMSPKEVTADFVYVRLHGPGDNAYEGEYDKKVLAGWAGAFHKWRSSGKDVYCYFDNDQNGYAPKDAIKLKKMCE